MLPIISDSRGDSGLLVIRVVGPTTVEPVHRLCNRKQRSGLIGLELRSPTTCDVGFHGALESCFMAPAALPLREVM